jgi:hypothetical protein
LAKKCSHEDSRLTCIECSAPICSSCMVVCPVGFKCKSCGTTTGSPIKKSSSVGRGKLFGLSTLVGAGGGWAMTFFSIPFLNCFLYFFVGLIAGQWLAKFIDYQLRDRAGKIIVLGTLLGMCLSPLVAMPPTMLLLLSTAFTTNPAAILPGFVSILSMLFTPTIFIVGILKPTVWGG